MMEEQPRAHYIYSIPKSLSPEKTEMANKSSFSLFHLKMGVEIL
jgi:hypothetical protein